MAYHTNVYFNGNGDNLTNCRREYPLGKVLGNDNGEIQEIKQSWVKRVFVWLDRNRWV